MSKFLSLTILTTPEFLRISALKQLTLSVLLYFFTFSVNAMQNNYVLTSENTLENDFEQLINPFWEQNVIKGEFTGANGVKIFNAYVKHPEPKGSIVISSGRTEAAIKYKEVIYDFYQNGYSVFILDHRGQGQSGRMAENRFKGHVENFDLFVQDLKQFYETVVKPNTDSKPNLVCHSMGGAIGALYAIQHPDDFEKVVFNAPMFGINMPIPGWLANGIASTSSFFGGLFSDEPGYSLGQGDWAEWPFEGNTVSQSEVRFGIHEQEQLTHPEIQLGGITFGWLKEALVAMDHIANNANKLKNPVLLLQASADVIVFNDSQNAACEKMPNCQLEVVKGAFHEIMMEQDQYRNPSMEKMLAFIESE